MREIAGSRPERRALGVLSDARQGRSSTAECVVFQQCSPSVSCGLRVLLVH
jgi:hypothetical protein